MTPDTAARLRALVANKQLWGDLTDLMDSSVGAMLSEATRSEDEKTAISLFLRAKAAQEFSFKLKSIILEAALNPADLAGE